MKNVLDEYGILAKRRKYQDWWIVAARSQSYRGPLLTIGARDVGLPDKMP